MVLDLWLPWPKPRTVVVPPVVVGGLALTAAMVGAAWADVTRVEVEPDGPHSRLVIHTVSGALWTGQVPLPAAVVRRALEPHLRNFAAVKR